MKRYIRSYTEADGYWYLSRHGVGPGCWPKDAKMMEYKEHPENAYKCYVKLDRMLTGEELKEYDLKEEMPADVEGASNTEYFANLVNGSKNTKSSIESLDAELEAAVGKFMCSPEVGFDSEENPDDKYAVYWKDYCQVLVAEPGEDGYSEVRVNAEIGYESFESLFEIINPIIEKYDKDAYFDMEAPGRAVAYVKIGNGTESITSATQVPDGVDMTENQYAQFLGAIKAIDKKGASTLDDLEEGLESEFELVELDDYTSGELLAAMNELKLIDKYHLRDYYNRLFNGSGDSISDDDDDKSDMFDQASTDEAYDIEEAAASELGVYFDFSSIRYHDGTVFIYSDPNHENDSDIWMGDDDAEVGSVDYQSWAYALANAVQNNNPKKFIDFVKSEISQ